MPPRARGRIRRRQLLTGGGIVAVVLAAVLSGVMVLTSLPHADRTQPGSGRRSSGSFRAVPSAPPGVATGDPITWSDVETKGGSTPYVDHEAGEHVVGQKIPVLSGEVTTPFSGGPVAFSLVVWRSDGGLYTAGEVIDLFEGYRVGSDPSQLGSDSVGGGSKIPLGDMSDQELSRPVVLTVRSRADGEHGESLLTLAGFVSPEVDRLELRAGDQTRDVRLVADPLDNARRLFVAYPALDPNGEAIGMLVALATDGSELWSGIVHSLIPPPNAGGGGSYSGTTGDG